MNVLCIIPARGGSKGLKNKNIKPLLGKPLIGYTIEAALASKLIDKIVISTDDWKIAKAALLRRYHVEVIKRPRQYATDSAPIELALRHAVRYLQSSQRYRADIVVWLQANVPIRKNGSIDKVIRKLIKTSADSVVTVTEAGCRPENMKRLLHGNRVVHLARPKEIRRQEYKDKLYLLNGAVIAMTRKALMSSEGQKGAHVYLGDDIRCVTEERLYSFEVDDQLDFDIVKRLLTAGKRRM